MAYEMDFAKELANLENQRRATNTVMEDPLSEFETTLRSFGLDPVGIAVSGYGKFKRIPSNVGGKRSKDSGWYWLEQDGDTMYAAFGDWRNGENEYWQSSNVKRLSPDERLELDKRIAAAKELHKKQLQAVRDKAAEKAVKKLSTLQPAKDHPYLKTKDVKAYGDIRTDGKDLYIPVTIGTNVRSYQRITPTGKKQFLYESETKGGYFWIAPTKSDDLYFTTGYATGATIHKATGASVMVCFNDSSMYEALSIFRAINKDKPVIVAADNDHHLDDRPDCENSGLKTGQKCVDDFAGVKMIYPEGIEGTDFNDMAKEKGLEFVKQKLTSYVPRIGMKLAKDIEIIETEWLVKNFLPKANIGLVYGPSNHMKSFLVFDWGLHIAAGLDWHGNKVKENGPVLYVCGEGSNTMASRIKAWTLKHEVDVDTLPFIITERAVHLLDDGMRFDLVQDLAYMNAQSGIKSWPSVIIIDTLNRNFGDGDENSTRDMTNFINAIDDLHEKTKSMILIVHHSGKSELMTARGSSALKASLDVEYQVQIVNWDEYQAGVQKPNVELKCTKMKNAEFPNPLIFEPEIIHFPNQYDSEGKQLKSVVLMPMEGESVTTLQLSALLKQPVAVAGNSKSEFALLALKEAFIFAGIETCKKNGVASFMLVVDRAELNERYRAICKKNELSMDTMRKAKHRALESLTEIGLLEPVGDDDPYVTTKNAEVIKEINNRYTDQ